MKMKKLVFSLLVLASMNACNTKETKNEATTSTDKESGSFTSMDEKSAKVKAILEAYAKMTPLLAIHFMQIPFR